MGSYLTSKRRVRNGQLERFCLVCADWHLLADMVPNARCSDGVRPLCKPCNRLHRLEYAKPRPNRNRYPLTERQRAMRNARRRAAYAKRADEDRADRNEFRRAQYIEMRQAGATVVDARAARERKAG